MKRSLRSGLVLLCLLANTAGSYGFETDSLYSLRHYTDEDGLPQNSVKAISRDKDGFVWLATENGLVRFDGRQFYIFNKKNRAFSSNRFVALFPDWQKNSLIAYTTRCQYVEIRNGSAWPIRNYRREQHQHYSYLTDSFSQGVIRDVGLPNLLSHYTRIRKLITPTSDSTCYISTADSTSFYRKGRREYTLRFPVADLWRCFSLGSALAYLDRNDHLVLLEQGQVLPAPIRGWPVGNDSVTTIYTDPVARTVVLYRDHKFYLLQKEGRAVSVRLLLSDFDARRNNIVSVCYDASRNRLYLGSLTRGLFVASARRFFVLVSQQTTSDEIYYAQTALSDSSILTPQGRVFTVSKHRKAMTGDYRLVGEKSYDGARSILVDHQGCIWTRINNKVFRFTPDGRHLLKEWSLPGELTQLLESPDSLLWVGSKRAGLFCIPNNGRAAAQPRRISSISSISVLLQYNRQYLWIGTGNGLCRLHLSSGEVEWIKRLNGKSIRSLHRSGNGALWIATYEDGLFLFRDGQLNTLPADASNYLSGIHCILKDTNGFFWLPTNKGLFQASEQDLLNYAAGRQDHVYYLYYGKEEGFSTNEFNGGCQPCGLQLRNGFVSFPSLNGLVVFDPSAIRPELPDSRLFVDYVAADTQYFDATDTVVLPRIFNQLKLHVTTPYAGEARNLMLWYRLADEGREWVRMDPEAHGMITLSALPAGRHRLLIRKANGFGNRFAYKELVLIVPHAFYETWWFRGLLLLLAGLLVYAYTRMRVRYVVRKNKLLELKIERRTRKLKHMLEVLEQSQRRLLRQTTLQERLVAAIGHDIRTPLKYLGITSRKVYEEISSETQGPLATMSKGVYELVMRMYHLTDNLLQYVSTQMKKGKVQLAPFDLVELVEEKRKLFGEIAAERELDFDFSHNGVAEVFSNRQLLAVVIHNLIDNAIKFTRQGGVRIRISEDKDQVILVISDDGAGMSAEIVDWMNEPGDPAQIDTYHHLPGHGMGLIIVRQLASLIRVSLQVRSRQHKGTDVLLLFRKND